VPAVVEVWCGASLVMARRKYIKRDRWGGDRRGCISDFSWDSRRRLQRTVAKVKRDQLPLFMTLTYPSEYPLAARVWKRHLDTWLKRVRRRFPGASAVWRLEFQRRGAPHYHLLVWGIKLSNWLKLWVSKSWYEVVGSGDIKHLRAGTQVQKVRSYRGVQSYVAKALGWVAGEMSKVSQVITDGVGRWWGVFNRTKLPWGVRVVMTCGNWTACTLIRYMRRFAGIKSRAYKSLTVYGDGNQWARAVMGHG